MAIGINITVETEDTFLVEMELTEEEREHCNWEGYVGTSTVLTKEQLIELNNRINILLGEING